MTDSNIQIKDAENNLIQDSNTQVHKSEIEPEDQKKKVSFDISSVIKDEYETKILSDYSSKIPTFKITGISSRDKIQISLYGSSVKINNISHLCTFKDNNSRKDYDTIFLKEFRGGQIKDQILKIRIYRDMTNGKYCPRMIRIYSILGTIHSEYHVTQVNDRVISMKNNPIMLEYKKASSLFFPNLSGVITFPKPLIFMAKNDMFFASGCLGVIGRFGTQKLYFSRLLKDLYYDTIYYKLQRDISDEVPIYLHKDHEKDEEYTYFVNQGNRWLIQN